MTGLVSDLVEWLRPAFTSAGYALVPAAMFLESAALLGVLVPGDVLLAVAGVYAAAGELSIGLVIVLGFLGAVLGETTGFLVGRRFGRAAVDRLPFANRLGPKVDRAARAIHDNAGKTIVIGRFATGAAGLVPFAAGTSDVGLRTFLLYAIPSIAVWATAVVLLGTVVGNNIELIDRILTSFGWIVLAGVAIVLGGRWWWRRHRRAART